MRGILCAIALRDGESDISSLAESFSRFSVGNAPQSPIGCQRLNKYLVVSLVLYTILKTRKRLVVEAGNHLIVKQIHFSTGGRE